MRVVVRQGFYCIFFVYFLSTIDCHVSISINFSFLFSCTAGVSCTLMKLSMFMSCYSCSTWKRIFNNSSLKASPFLNCLAYLSRIAVDLFSSFVFRSFKGTVATTCTRSLPTSAPPFGLTYCCDLLHFWFVIA